MALTPFVANTSTIDYQTKAGAKLWKQSSKGLYGDSEELRYDLTTKRLMSFLDDLTNRAKKCGWLVLMQISKDGVTKSMLTQYADIDRKDAKTFLDTELDATTHPRKVQDDTALYHCLYDSLNIDARNWINLKKDDFTLSNNTESGVLLIKVITMAAQVATRSMATLLMSQLMAGMHQLYDECGGNIIKFHETIRSKMRTLSSYGSPVGDKALIPALMMVYKKTSKEGNEFTCNVELIKGKYNNGENYNNYSIMDEVELKYKEWVEETKAEGKDPVQGKDKIIALQTQLKTMNKTLQKALSQSTPANDGKEKDQKKSKKSKEWMSKKPKEGEPHTKKVNGKTYHWCEGNDAHKPKWVIHDPKMCSGLKDKDEKEDGSEKSKSKLKSKSQPEWEIDQAIIEDDE
jgi:hypothetical protein